MLGIDPLIGGALVILASSGGMTTNAALCDMPHQTVINVRPHAKEVKYDYSQSLDEIQQYTSDTVNPYDFHKHTKTQGLAKAAIKLKLEMKLGNRSQPNLGKSCVWYESINVDINIAPEIIIAKEVYRDKCKYKAVLEHELKHVRADRIIVNQLSQNLGQKIYSALKQRGFHSGVIRTAYAEEIAERMQKTVSQVVEFEQQKIEIARIEAQSAIDTLEEYERVSNMCR